MKKIILCLLLLSVFVFAQSNATKLKGAMNQLQETARTTLLMTAAMQIFGGLVFLAVGILIYYFKLKGAIEPQTLMWVIAIIACLFGLFLFIGGLFGVIAYLTAPIILSQTVS